MMYIKGVKVLARIKFDFLAVLLINQFVFKLKKSTCIISCDVFKYYMKKRLHKNLLRSFKTLSKGRIKKQTILVYSSEYYFPETVKNNHILYTYDHYYFYIEYFLSMWYEHIHLYI